ncbi:UDP-glucose dehydrogenase family protein [Tardiphaga sp. 709]|jgi:UDPglucose 6-dehydrogenase|uniref:UDP-glucose dehydrogenase family protein n=1 Tax=unclassified Tardiphaga TaxID=2631404 RepID=UPI0028F07587|nr:nucleotide sugar dehydrogenase [Tardiphaga sp. 709]WNV09178.1 nucleotide sugar dehydrogenase [Tardiphaga sp. 709]
MNSVNQPPRISIIGLGKLGSPMAAVMAAKGFDVIGLDLNDKLVNAVNQGQAAVDEPQLQEYMDKARSRLRATHSWDEVVQGSDVTFIIVPTPSGNDKLFSNKFVLSAVRSIGEALRSKKERHVVVVTSTVMPGSTGGEIQKELEDASGRVVGPQLGLAYNPEFIALGTVVRDMLRPDFILIGESDTTTGEMLERLYKQSCDNDPIIRRMSFVNAELTKISVNTYVTTKISYANMLAEMCDKLPGADVDVVSTAVGSDTRVGSKYIKGAIGYGGPCFPRDNKAFAALGRMIGARCDLAEATDKINDHQIERLIGAVQAHAEPPSRVAVLGLSYKPDTPVVEESQGVALAAQLSAAGYVVTVYDPLAMQAAEVVLVDQVLFANDLADAVAADVIVITTPWPQFKGRNLFDLGAKPKVIIDPWRVVSAEDVPAGTTLARMGYGSR